jgi:IS605 OrfB family transposase
MIDTHIITRKIALTVLGDTKEIKDESWSKIRNISYENFKAINLVLSTLYSKDNLVESIVKGKFTPTQYSALNKEELKEVYKQANVEINNNISLKSIYTDVITRFKNLPSACVPSTIKVGEGLYKNNFIELKRGDISLPTIKEGYPIATIKTYLKIDESYEFNWYSKIKLGLFFGRDRSNNRQIVDRVISQEYTLCDSTIQLKEGKLFLLLVVKVPKKVVHLDSDVTVGVDLGVSSAAVCALNKGLNRLSIPSSILKPRLRIQAQRRYLQKALKYSGGGKGRDKKLKKLDYLLGAERNTVRTLNHKVAYDVIDFCLKNNAHKVILEDLKGFSKEDKDNFILRNWSYFELQTLIEQKADKYNIIVEYVSPTYTSQTCNECGCKGERKVQSEFVCKNNKCIVYDKKVNADFNAAKNISNGGLGFSYNKETKEFFESLEYGQVVLPKVEGKNSHSISSVQILNLKSRISNCESVL